jgi:hypothetical protein
MGYRSDVTFAFYAKPDKSEMLPAIRLWVEENWSREGDPFIEPLTDIILVKYDDVKWLSGTPLVDNAWDAINLFEQAFDTEDFETHRACWEYARVGEDITDLDTGGSAYHHYRLDIQRSITVT